MLRNDVLIENNKYCCVIMQNNGAMTSRMCKQLKPDVLSARLWTPGMRLVFNMH